MINIVDRLRATADFGIPDYTNSKLLREASDEIVRLREENSRLREVLKPFAYIAEHVGEEDARWAVPSAHLRAAAAALKEAGDE